MRIRFHQSNPRFPKVRRRIEAGIQTTDMHRWAQCPTAGMASPLAGRAGSAARMSIEPNTGKRGAQ